MSESPDIPHLKIATLSGLLTTSSADGTAKIWDAASGERQLTLAGHSGSANDVDISPDGKRLVSAGYDGIIRLWILPLDELVALAQSRLTRSLTTAECQQYLHVEECP